MRAVILLCLLSQVVAGPSKPDITIGINSDNLDKDVLAALEPNIKWQTSGELAGCDVEVCDFIETRFVRGNHAMSAMLTLFVFFIAWLCFRAELV